LNGFVKNIFFIITKKVIEELLLEIFLHTSEVYDVTIADDITFITKSYSKEVKFGFFCWNREWLFFFFF